MLAQCLAIFQEDVGDSSWRSASSPVRTEQGVVGTVSDIGQTEATEEIATRSNVAQNENASIWTRVWNTPTQLSDGHGSAGGHQEDLWSSMEGLQMLDKHAEPVHVMPGGNEIMGAVLMGRKQLDEYQKWRPKCLTRNLCPAPEGYTRCSWCAQGRCQEGSLRTNGRIVTGASVESKLYVRAQEAAAGFVKYPQRHRKVKSYPLIFSCALKEQVPMHVPGVFNMTWPVDNQPVDLVVSNALVRRPVVAPPGSAAVCGRAGFGAVGAGNLVALSEYYRFHGFESVYTYDAGSSSLTEPLQLEMYQRRLAQENSKALRVIDMRGHLDRLYGGAHDFMLLFSKAGGQMWAKFECQLRARRDGHTWVLHTDLDEYVFPGINLIRKPERDPATPLAATMIEMTQGMHGLTIGGLNPGCDPDVHANIAWPLDKAASEARWRAFMHRVTAKHVEEEYPDAANVFARAGPLKAPHCFPNGTSPDPKAHCNYHLVLRGSGTRKLFVRSDMAPQVIRVHEASRAVRSVMRDLDVDDLFHRHYRCANINSEPQHAIEAIGAF